MLGSEMRVRSTAIEPAGLVQIHWKSKDGFSISSKLTENTDARVVLTNKFNKKKDTTFFHIDVVKDEFPTIITEEVKDTLKEGLHQVKLKR